MIRHSGDILKQARERKEISQPTLARLIKCDRSVITKLEKGTLALSIAWAKKIAPHLDMKAIEFFPDLLEEDRAMGINVAVLNADAKKSLEDFFQLLLKNQAK